MGRPDVEGMRVNVVARLHKLIPNEPGHIFLDGATRDQLRAEQQARCRSFGLRDLKGIGKVEVFNMDWDDDRTSAATLLTSHTEHRREQDLVLVIGGVRRSFGMEQKTVTIGRSSKCDIVLSDVLISSRHVEFAWEGGKWSVRDISRNGTWARLAGPGTDIQLGASSVPIAAAGAICLGQPFAKDPQGSTTVEFEQVPRSE